MDPKSESETAQIISEYRNIIDELKTIKHEGYQGDIRINNKIQEEIITENIPKTLTALEEPIVEATIGNNSIYDNQVDNAESASDAQVIYEEIKKEAIEEIVKDISLEDSRTKISNTVFALGGLAVAFVIGYLLFRRFSPKNKIAPLTQSGGGDEIFGISRPLFVYGAGLAFLFYYLRHSIPMCGVILIVLGIYFFVQSNNIKFE